MIKRRPSVVRKALYPLLLLIVFFAIYAFYGMSQAKQMASDVCKRAVPGMPLEDLLATVSEKDFRIIRSAEYTIIVPRNGMGRANCTVRHDGKLIKSSRQGFTD